MAAHHVGIYRDILSGVFPAEQSLFLKFNVFPRTVPWEHVCASAQPSFLSVSLMRTQGEELYCVLKEGRIKKKDIKKRGGAWSKEGVRKKGLPWGEKLSVPGRHQTQCSPVISLHPGSPLTAPWLYRLDSFILVHRYEHLTATRAHSFRLIHSCSNTFVFHTFTHRQTWDAQLRSIYLVAKIVKDTWESQIVAAKVWARRRPGSSGSHDDVEDEDDNLSEPSLLLCWGLWLQRQILPDDEFISA